MGRFLLLAFAAALVALPVPGRAGEAVPVLAAENVYGDIAEQVGGVGVRVTSILTNPDQDPHLFEASPSVARAVAGARVIIENGAGYDPWMDKLVQAVRDPGRTVIVVAELVGKKPGDNPHLWYDPAAALALARTLAAALAQADPPHQADYRHGLDRFEHSLLPVQAKIAALRGRLAGTAVTATEPVFGPVLDSLGLHVRNPAFQLAVMNNTEPGAADIAAFEGDLTTHRVRLLVFNTQTADPIARRMRKLAEAAGVPVVGVSETEPPGTTYQAWLLDELDAMDRALATAAP